MKPVSISIAVLLLCGLVLGQMPDQPQQVSAYQTYVFMQGNLAPAERRASDIFLKIANDLDKFLRDNRVNMTGDPSGMNSRSESNVPLETVLANGKRAGAASVLYSKIEVPGKAVHVTTTAYALDGNKIWETSAGCDLADRVPLDVCMKVTLETLHESLKYRIREQDLPVIAEQKK
jgi:hypothetical protein